MISGLHCRSKHNNNPSDSRVGSPFRKYSFLAQLGLRLDEKLRAFSLAPITQGAWGPPKFQVPKGSITWYHPFLNIHTSDVQLELYYYADHKQRRKEKISLGTSIRNANFWILGRYLEPQLVVFFGGRLKLEETICCTLVSQSEGTEVLKADMKRANKNLILYWKGDIRFTWCSYLCAGHSLMANVPCAETMRLHSLPLPPIFSVFPNRFTATKASAAV